MEPSTEATVLEVKGLGGGCASRLTYNAKSPIGDGGTERTDCGLSDLGVAVVGEANRVGMVVDLSHTGFRNREERN